MQRIGITGGIGMGKSTAAEILTNLGIPVIDSDVIARRIVEPGTPTLNEIKSEFGERVIGEDGHLRRDALASIVFSNPDARAKLESILHPKIRTIWLAELEGWRKAGQNEAAVVIPLLFETKAEPHFESIICVACSKATQLNRLHARGLADAQIQQRIQSQMPIDEKMRRADYVVWTEGEIANTEAQLRRILHLTSRD